MMTKAIKWIAWGLALTVVILCVIPAPQLVEVSNVDKVEHVLAFAALSFVFLRAYHRHTLWVITGCVVLGLAIELVQYFIPWRSAEFADLVADVFGVLLGCIAFLGFQRVGKRETANE